MHYTLQTSDVLSATGKKWSSCAALSVELQKKNNPICSWDDFRHRVGSSEWKVFVSVVGEDRLDELQQSFHDVEGACFVRVLRTLEEVDKLLRVLQLNQQRDEMRKYMENIENLMKLRKKEQHDEFPPQKPPKEKYKLSSREEDEEEEIEMLGEEEEEIVLVELDETPRVSITSEKGGVVKKSKKTMKDDNNSISSTSPSVVVIDNSDNVLIQIQSRLRVASREVEENIDLLRRGELCAELSAIPNVQMLASMEEGQKLALDTERLKLFLLDEMKDKNNINSAPSNVRKNEVPLTRWWKLARRALSVVGLMSFLRSGKKNVKKTLREQCGAQVAFSMSSLNRLERLGKCLEQWPMLMLQSQFVSWIDWVVMDVPVPSSDEKINMRNRKRQRSDGGALRKLVDALALILSPEEQLFWQRSLSDVVENSDLSVCASCKKPNADSKCCKCRTLFHNVCAGYEDHVLRNIPQRACATCASNTDMVVEMNDTSKFLMENQFQIQQQSHQDLYSGIHVLEEYARHNCAFEGNSELFCARLAASALQNGVSDVESVERLESMKRGRYRVRRIKEGLLKLSDYLAIFNGFAKEKKIQIHLYGPTSSTTFGDRENEAILNILQWKTIGYFDKLLKK